MNQTVGPGAKPARGPDGCLLTIADLPPPNTQRWVIRRKAIVAAAVRGGLISLEAACSRYRLNPEELLSWQYYIDRYGFSALRTTKVQSYVRPGQRKFGLGIRDRAPTDRRDGKFDAIPNFVATDIAAAADIIRRHRDVSAP
jgi:hypothetical protein